jgi:tetratricopeptide (TPR) repeat protein
MLSLNKILVALALLTLCGSAPAAHEGVHELIQKATVEIKKDPHDWQLYLYRAQLYRMNEDWPEARADLDFVRTSAPDDLALVLEEAHLFHAQGLLLQALQKTEQYHQHDVKNARSWQLHARLLFALKKYQQAADAMQTAIPLFPTPEPDYFHFQAKALQNLGPVALPKALLCVEQGLKSIGACVSLELLAVDLETDLGMWQQAIARIDRLATSARRKESWLMHKADVYWRCGKRRQAKREYQAALNAIQLLRPRTQNTPAVKKMQKLAQLQLGKL